MSDPAEGIRNCFHNPPLPGAAPVLLSRETGYALKLIAPAGKPSGVSEPPRPDPPGQGQVIVALRGRTSIDEVGGAEGRVVSTTRKSGAVMIGPGELFRVANDARWSARAENEDSLLLALSTSVPREQNRTTDINRAAARRRHMGSVRLFGNEVVHLDFVVARGRLPLRGWMPWRPSSPGLEHFFVLRGAFRLRLRAEDSVVEHVLQQGDLLRIPPGPEHQLAVSGSNEAVGLLVTGRSAQVGGPVSREAARGFTPFG